MVGIPHDVYDGLAIASSAICILLGFCFLRFGLLERAQGAKLMSVSMFFGAWVWGMAGTVGAFSFSAGWPAVFTLFPLVVAIPAMLHGAIALAIHVEKWQARLVWGSWLFLVVLSVSLDRFLHVDYAVDNMVAGVLFVFGVFNWYISYRKPKHNFRMLAVAAWTEPAMLVFTRLHGITSEDSYHVVGVTYVLIGLSALLVSLLASRRSLTLSLESIQRKDERLQQLLYVDETTGLPSAQAHREKMVSLVEARSDFCLLVFNLDNLRSINDNLGTEGGNFVLREVAQTLRETLKRMGDGWELSRGPGAEFRVLLKGLANTQTARDRALGLIEAVRKPVAYEDGALYLVCSAGISCYPDDSNVVEELVRRAGVALHRARDLGGNLACSFEAEMDAGLRERMWFDHHLPTALEQGQFELHYQPKLLISSGHATAVEALIRWKHPERGNVRPDEFIGRAEATGLIIPIGRWVLVTAAQQAAAWAASGLQVRIAVNLSIRQLADEGLKRVLEDAQRIAQGLLDVEITESSLGENDQALLELVAHCRALGFGVHLDDFGTGYSSLSRLGQLPLSIIKLDRAFILPIGRNEKANALVRAMVAIGTELDLQIVAEGVETEDQVEFLRDLGVHYAQGWLYARAMDSANCEAWLVEHQQALVSA